MQPLAGGKGSGDRGQAGMRRVGAYRAAAAGLLALAIACCDAGSAVADRVVVHDADARAAAVKAIYRFDSPLTGRGTMEVEWTDALGRIVQQFRRGVDLKSTEDVPFTLDARRAVTVSNRVTARIVLDNSGGNVPFAEHEATAEFTAAPTSNPWSDYQIIMWQPETAAGYAALNRLGLTGGAVASDRADRPGGRVTGQVRLLLDADLGWYLENIATDFYSAYHRWFPNRPVNWRFRAVKKRYWSHPDERSTLTRDPSLSDPAWLTKIRARLIASVQVLGRYKPLFYNLADEPGIADLSAFWDFDFSPASLAGMREWLKRHYGSLARLNAEWGTAFRAWDAVVPMTTRRAMRQSNENFAAWADFKEWMDVAFARALRSGTDALHNADPKAISAIEGAQIPGWGGYDYSRLAHSVDAMELYDYGDNVEILRSFNQKAIMLTTTSSDDPAVEEHRVWRELLRGTRGLIVWDAHHHFVSPDGSLGDRARAAAPYYHEIRHGLGALLINSHRVDAPIGILYSPASMRIEWLLDRIDSGEDWTRRSASTEYADDRIRVSTRNFARAIEHLGLQQRFLSARQVEHGALKAQGYRVLILPGTIALSTQAAQEIRDFVGSGGTVIADGEPATFDEHGRKRLAPALAELDFHHWENRAKLSSDPAAGRAISFTAPAPQNCAGRGKLAEILAAAGVPTGLALTGPDGARRNDVEIYRFADGGVTIVALLRDRAPDCSGSVGDTAVLHLPHPYDVYDLRARRPRGRRSRVEVNLSLTGPTILALAHQPLIAPMISGLRGTKLGDLAVFHIVARSASQAAFDVVHVEVIDPRGKVVPYYSRNVLWSGYATSIRVPLAFNDPPGVWHIGANDLLSGATVFEQFEVKR